MKSQAMRRQWTVDHVDVNNLHLIFNTRIVIKTVLNILCKTIPLWCAIFSDDYDVVYTVMY